MTGIPLGAEVECRGGACGHATHAIINLSTRRVTRLVVKERGLHPKHRQVPLDRIAHVAADRITLRCTRRELAGMRAFFDTHLVQAARPRWECYAGSYMECVCRHLREWVPSKHECIRPTELALRPGIRVRTADGREGSMKDLLMERATGCIAYVVVCVGEPGTWETVAIPVADVSRIGGRASGWPQGEPRLASSAVDLHRPD